MKQPSDYHGMASIRFLEEAEVMWREMKGCWRMRGPHSYQSADPGSEWQTNGLSPSAERLGHM